MLNLFNHTRSGPIGSISIPFECLKKAALHREMRKQKGPEKDIQAGLPPALSNHAFGYRNERESRKAQKKTFKFAFARSNTS